MNYIVYHISDNPGKNYLTEGYIGITKNEGDRWAQHSRTDSKIGEHIRENEWTVDNMMTLFSGLTRKQALWIEKLLRPKVDIGLNVAPGGNP